MEENKIKDKAESWFALNAYKGYDKYDVFEAGYKAGLESQSALNDKWISVEERLPEEYGQYLCSNGMAIAICGLLQNKKDFFGILGTTHWMPLPNNPI